MTAAGASVASMGAVCCAFMVCWVFGLWLWIGRVPFGASKVGDVDRKWPKWAEAQSARKCL
jgi:uncharacterized iron-regulated membrane protein